MEKNSLKVKSYWVKVVPMLILQIIYLFICNSFGHYTRVYCDFTFYLIIAVYFALWHDWGFRNWFVEWKKGKVFWFPVLFTILGTIVAFGLGELVVMIFPHGQNGMGVFGVNNLSTMIAFIFTTIFLPPIAEEMFYRKALTAFDSKAVIITTAIISVLLYASEHSMMPLGFFQACLWGIPFSIAYIKTKNIYVSMTAHLICNLAINGITVIIFIPKLFG